jgi:hypothetical protein
VRTDDCPFRFIATAKYLPDGDILTDLTTGSVPNTSGAGAAIAAGEDRVAVAAATARIRRLSTWIPRVCLRFVLMRYEAAQPSPLSFIL